MSSLCNDSSAAIEMDVTQLSGVCPAIHDRGDKGFKSLQQQVADLVKKDTMKSDVLSLKTKLNRADRSEVMSVNRKKRRNIKVLDEANAADKKLALRKQFSTSVKQNAINKNYDPYLVGQTVHLNNISDGEGIKHIKKEIERQKTRKV